MLQDVLEPNPNLTEEQKSAITQWVAATVGVAVGGQTGGATALDNVNFNYLNHADNDKLNEAKAACTKGDQAACSEKARLESKDQQQQKAYVDCRNTGYSGTGCSMGKVIGTAGETNIRIVVMNVGGSEIRSAYPWP
ncbi:DUF6862 domain-containing protein [Rhizobium mesosinicum]|uniref:Uncharacterized protein n=1 Tax=Rhizobium mesosinicum TaxID=335017 RepID=A0ABS7H3C3_9HYPH|nr:hypothetical protein [Rhizobium mesosinicum]MBW9056676.1 hypothetical protein [Rhizobium mesosinicum]